MESAGNGWSWAWLTLPQRAALLVVDAQVGFAGPHTAHVESRIASLVEQRAGDFSIIIATQFFNAPDSNFRRLIDWHGVSESPATDLFEPVQAAAHCVIAKHTYGASDEIARLLADRGIEDVFVCGIDTDVCVLQNAAGLFDRGYYVRVLLDACGTNGGPLAQEASRPLLMRTIGARQTISAAGH